MSFYKNGIVQMGSISNFTPIYEMPTKQLDDGSVWRRIHWLDVTTDKTFFASNDEVAECLDKSNRYSRMGIVDRFKGYKLPSNYTKLDYIESDGTQFINTGYYWTSEAVKVTMDAMVTANASSQSLFGNEEPFSGGRYFSIVPHGSNGTYSYYVGSSTSIASASTGLNSRFTMECETTTAKALTVKINGTTSFTKTYAGTVMAYANTTSTHASKGLIYIFANHNSSTAGAGGIQQVGGMKLYGFKMYDNGVIVRDFIPVKKTDGTIGLLDRIYNVFYPNAGTGTFIAGPVSELQKADTGVYEFMLTYPSLSTTLYNRWTQTSSPNESTVAGFTKITEAWGSHNKGIRKHSDSFHIYDCDSGSTWFAPVGQLKRWDSAKLIPSADGSSQTETELWVRIDLLSLEDNLGIYKDNELVATEFIEF